MPMASNGQLGICISRQLKSAFLHITFLSAIQRYILLKEAGSNLMDARLSAEKRCL
uniref:Uncharacterized protein n=1 Tax=Arundo donax TaxID=35708 RepID=A0A0A8YE31_ARUDO